MLMLDYKPNKTVCIDNSSAAKLQNYGKRGGRSFETIKRKSEDKKKKITHNNPLIYLSQGNHCHQSSALYVPIFFRMAPDRGVCGCHAPEMSKTYLCVHLDGAYPGNISKSRYLPKLDTFPCPDGLVRLACLLDLHTHAQRAWAKHCQFTFPVRRYSGSARFRITSSFLENLVVAIPNACGLVKYRVVRGYSLGSYLGAPARIKGHIAVRTNDL
ncbi:hypothetical protein F5X96DRAFT_635777 [Biscogniauxia mediterranea]|nr:hypothetical protein F5X96DRAFT_635777 [Biscogniauxia mediterranea]